MRTAASSVRISFETIPELKNYRPPSCTTMKRWAQKVGYYKLKCAKTISNDWIVMIDASIQMGEKKCVLILGCRAAHLPSKRALILEDLEVLSMRIVSSLNSKIITQMLSNVNSVVGKIISICSDRGSEIIRGVKDFQADNPGVRHIGDTAHRVSNLLEAVLEKCPKWRAFREQVTQGRRKMQNSLVSGALPPSPRAKARYMNVGCVIKWAVDMLVLLDHGDPILGFDVDELRKYLGWLISYRDDIIYWSRLTSIGEIARQIVRLEGIHSNIVDSFEQAISIVKMGTKEMWFADQLTTFLLNQSKGMKPTENFIGSTEVLESLFGKIKYMEREQRAFGFTSLLLAALASVGPLDEVTIANAMMSVKLADLDKWSMQEIGQSVQSERRKIKKIVADLQTKSGQEISGILERVAA